jgi:hypothetical protein
MTEDETTLIETIVPVLHHDENAEEVAFIIDDMVCKIFKKFSIIKVYTDHIDTDEYKYFFQTSDVLSWGTRLPQLRAIMKVPECTSDIIEGQCDIKIQNDYVILNDTLHIKVFKKFSDFEGLSIYINILKDIWSDHTGQHFKLYLEEEFPLCIEFLEPKVRYYVAPIDIQS